MNVVKVQIRAVQEKNEIIITTRRPFSWCRDFLFTMENCFESFQIYGVVVAVAAGPTTDPVCACERSVDALDTTEVFTWVDDRLKEVKRSTGICSGEGCLAAPVDLK